jgi:hypothetical protein
MIAQNFEVDAELNFYYTSSLHLADSHVDAYTHEGTSWAILGCHFSSVPSLHVYKTQ